MKAVHHMRSMTAIALLALTLPTLAAARTWHVPGDAPTIQAGIDSAGAGDDVLVAPGTYFEYGIAMKSGVQVHSEQGPCVTTVDAGGNGRGFDCTDLYSVVLEGFTITNGRAPGGGEQDASGSGVRSVRSGLVIHDCVITDCGVFLSGNGGGICAWESDVQIIGCKVTDCLAFQGGGIAVWYGTATTIADCEVLRNHTSLSAGILAWDEQLTIVRCKVANNVASFGCGGIGCYSPTLSIQECLIVGNETGVAGPSALCVSGSAGSISGCTITGNDSFDEEPCVVLNYCELGIELDRTIIAFNSGIGLQCGYLSEVSVHCCDVFANTGGDDLCGTDLGGNFSEDPLFCDPENGDYTLDGCSPCLPGNHPHGVDCGLIGALGQGCGATAVEETSWGRIKGLYRR